MVDQIDAFIISRLTLSPCLDNCVHALEKI